ncbi:MAG: hypothetical protein QM791_02135 [Ferruginibacter sp.]
MSTKKIFYSIGIIITSFKSFSIQAQNVPTNNTVTSDKTTLKDSIEIKEREFLIRYIIAYQGKKITKKNLNYFKAMSFDQVLRFWTKITPPSNDGLSNTETRKNIIQSIEENEGKPLTEVKLKNLIKMPLNKVIQILDNYQN